MDQPQQHFLVVSFPAQGHINPSLQLAKRLARLGAQVTFSTATEVHRRIPLGKLPHCLLAPPTPSEELKSVGSRTLAELARDLAAAGRPVTCVVYNFLVPWAAAVARDLGVPPPCIGSSPPPSSPSTTSTSVAIPASSRPTGRTPSPSRSTGPAGSPRPRRPSLLFSRNPEDDLFFPLVEELFQTMDTKARVLVNTFEALELDYLKAAESVELLPIGPTLPSAYADGLDGTETSFGGDLFQQTPRESYTAWLDAQPDRSVVYREEISRALEDSQRSYLWVARGAREGVKESSQGMVVEWCSQVEVLSHRAVGCFVTHCGWNSTLESLACGVPIVGMPKWSDQPANAHLAEPSAEGLPDAAELRRCLDLVMGEGQRGEAVRQRAEIWGRRAREAVREGGSSDRNLMAFVQQRLTD
ncbi:unnamed protein product [Spirodela intermedia]|uniref:Glycosyltransferase n=1 Tax=Spirodela intermedia TaxID=51605 RepID=A0A7I8J9F1_SPIIN|nr:unnamed protein product [Spirodela intermedia]CAA6666700.1 unnamed protein product [Spirodela intermedia]